MFFVCYFGFFRLFKLSCLILLPSGLTLHLLLIFNYIMTNGAPSFPSPGSQLLQELKKMDDKALLVEVQLLESKTYHALSNLPKARAALTSARTTANAIYCPPKLQAALDMQSGESPVITWASYLFCADDPLKVRGCSPVWSCDVCPVHHDGLAVDSNPPAVVSTAGIIHAAEEKDWKTAYSYFFEAFEGYDSIDSPRAITALKYMLLCKIVLNL